MRSQFDERPLGRESRTEYKNILKDVWATATQGLSESVFSADFNEIPTHPQSLLLHDTAMDFLIRFHRQMRLSNHLRNTPIFIATGRNDPACENEYIMMVVDTLKDAGFNVQHREFNTGHNGLLECPDAQAFFRQWCDDVEAGNLGRQNSMAATAQGPKTAALSRDRSTLQRGTSPFYPRARLG